MGGEDGRPSLLAHRGIAQTFALDGVQGDTCTATRIQVTADGQLAVFHDATLQCRTDGTGRVRDHTLAELRRLDLGYGYTADGGATYPLRGKVLGLMPTVPEVVAAFPDRQLSSTSRTMTLPRATNWPRTWPPCPPSG